MDDELKQRVMYAVIAFTWVVMIFQWFFNSGDVFTFGKAFLGVFLGIVAGGIAFGVTVVMQNR